MNERENSSLQTNNIDNELFVKPFKTTKTKVKSRPTHDDHTVPKHPFRAILSGASGSGKTNLLLHLLKSKSLYGAFFDIIFIISPTAGKLDDSYEALKKTSKKINIINDLNPDTMYMMMLLQM